MSATPTNANATRWILWAALIASVAIDAAVPSLIAQDPVPAPVALRGVLTTLALACAAGALAVHHLGLRRPIARGALDPASPDGAPRVTAIFVVSWLLAETPAVLGLVLALLTGAPRAGWRLAALSVALLLVLTPRVAAAPPSLAALVRGDAKIG